MKPNYLTTFISRRHFFLEKRASLALFKIEGKFHFLNISWFFQTHSIRHSIRIDGFVRSALKISVIKSRDCIKLKKKNSHTYRKRLNKGAPFWA